MRHILLLIMLLIAIPSASLTLGNAAAWADSLVGSSSECGLYEWDGSLTKGRTDSVVARYDHTVGCFRYKGFTVIGADREEMASNPQREKDWQDSECQKSGVAAVVGHFKYYRNIDIDPATVKVTCSRYSGPD